ncbi:hypothetical protein [Runella sp.]|uniref:hypothetical protein n=1 Tax=Runella sp. TaxID=1960881 RepID=UPI003016C4DB
MKKLLFVCLSLFLITLPSLAQTYTVTTGLPIIEIATPSTGVTTPTMGSNGYRDITIGFNFNFYGISYSQLMLGDNGWITFCRGIANNAGGKFSLKTGPNLLAFAWMDQTTTPPGVVTNYFVHGNAPSRVKVKL